MDSPSTDRLSKPDTRDILFSSCSSPPFSDTCATELMLKGSPAWEEKVLGCILFSLLSMETSNKTFP